MTDELSFRGRNPARLAFGTSGLRGLVSEITDLEAYINTRGFLDYLRQTGQARPGQEVALAGDLRPSTHSEGRSILRAVARAVQDAGNVVAYCGRIPTPALSSFAFQAGIPSIMVTGSHIPFDRNGIKFNKPNGEVLKSDEPAILAAVARARALEYGREPGESLFQDDGSFKAGTAPELAGPHVHDQEARAREHYLQRYVNFFPQAALEGLRVVVFEHSAVGRDLLGDLLRALGAQVLGLGRSESFVALDTEAVSDEQLGQLQKLADEARAAWGPVDALVSTDGDSDRPLIAALDEQNEVRFFPGDQVGILTAKFLQADGAAVPVSATDAIETALENVQLRRTQIGSPHVIAGMLLLPAGSNVGWEANGGFLTGSRIERSGAVLEPLPTRDAALPILAVLCAAKQARLTLPQLFDRLPRRYTRATLLDAIEPSRSRALLDRFALGLPGVRQVEFTPGGVLLVTENGSALAEPDQARRALEIRTQLQRELSRPLGGHAILRLNVFDGLRVIFENSDIVHLRPSGNAPQLRVYVVAGSQARAQELLNTMSRPAGVLHDLLATTDAELFVEAISRSIAHTNQLFARGNPAGTLATVSGSRAARHFWQTQLEAMRADFRAQRVLSFHEDLPVNQAFGVLLLWQRLRPVLVAGQGVLAAFVFGEGSRATPFTETDNGQKPAMASYVFHGTGAERRNVSMVELGMWHFSAVEAHLRRSGFEGLVIKWGDEVQIPTRDLSGVDKRWRDADVVRFVSLRPMNDEEARNKDWLGVDSEGRLTAFIPRRPLEEMRALSKRGLLLQRGDQIWGGVNLGSIALSRPLLDALLAEFATDIADEHAERRLRPDLDPQFFTVLTIAAISDPEQRQNTWDNALAELPAVRKLHENMPDILARVLRALGNFERLTGRKPNLLALDFGAVFWGDIGQHKQIYEFYRALNDPGPAGRIARSLAGLDETRDARGNWIAGETQLGPDVEVENSVLIHCRIARGRVSDSVLIGTEADTVDAEGAFDVLSVVKELTLASRAGSYKVVSAEPVHAAAGERVTTVFLPDQPRLFRVSETTDLRDRKHTYERAILGNPTAFSEAHALMSELAPEDVAARRLREIQAIRGRF